MADDKTPIRIGNRILEIGEPNGWKFLRATELLAQISAEIPELQEVNERFVDEYRQRHGSRIERWEAVARWPVEQFPDGLASMPEEWWKKRGNVAVLPGPAPSGTEQAMAMFTHVLKAAKDPAVELIAVLAAPDGELAEADRSKDLAAYLDGFKSDLLHGGKVSQLALILTRSLQAMRDEFAADGEAAAALGEIRAFFNPPATQTPPSSSIESSESAPGSEPAAEETPTPQPDAAVEPPPRPEPEPTATEERPTSSTASPPPTDGTDTTPSTDPPGPSSVASQPESASVS